MKNSIKFSLVLLVSLVVAGCGGRKTVGEVEPEMVDVGADVSSAALDGQGGIAGENLDGQNLGLGGADDPLSKRVIYFDYDSSLLTIESEGVVQAHAQYLSQAPGVQVILEGHADERGTREYNLALAEDRARAVASVMQVMGIPQSRIQTVSYGEERPVALGHDESSWGLNRRVEILYQ